MKYILLAFLFISCSTFNNQFGPQDNLSYLRIPSSEGSLFQIQESSLTRLYSKSLKAKPKKWLAQIMPSQFHLPSSGPSNGFYNRAIIWAVDDLDRTLAGFRPVNTTTGCNSGCSPVVFHLKITDNGTVTELIEDPNELLRKKWHKPYTKEDKLKAQKLAILLPEALIKISEPKLLADDLSTYPPQTWTAFDDLLVAQSAYTSYRIVQAAFQLRDFLQTTPQEKNTNDQYLQYVSQHINGIWKNLNQVKNSFSTLQKIIAHPNIRPSIKAHILSNPQNVLLNLIAYGSRREINSVKNFLNKKEFKTTHRGVVCNIKKRLLSFKKGQSILIQMGHQPESWPKCNKTLDSIYPLLAAASLEDLSSAKRFKQGMDIRDIPPVVKQDSLLLQNYAKLAKLLKDDKTYELAVSNLKTRYPLLKMEIKVSSDSLADAELEYRKELKRAMLHADISFPRFIGNTYNGDKVEFPLKGKQIYVFFATWCPHCKEKIKQWSSFPESFWDKLVLVEVFPKESSRTRIDKFCQETHLEQKYCNKIITIDHEGQRNQLYQNISLAGVPRIIITRPDQKIGYFDYKPPHQKGSDVQRDIYWILDEVKTPR